MTGDRYDRLYQAAGPIALSALETQRPDPVYPFISSIDAQHDNHGMRLIFYIRFSNGDRHGATYHYRLFEEVPISAFIQAIWTIYNEEADRRRPGMVCMVERPMVPFSTRMEAEFATLDYTTEPWLTRAERLRVAMCAAIYSGSDFNPTRTVRPPEPPRPRPQPSRSPKPGAAQRGRELLLSQLTEKQREDYTTNGWFTVIGGSTGRKYTICHGKAMNIFTGKTTMLCLTTKEPMVTGDVLLTQKLALELDEDTALREANIFTRSEGSLDLYKRVARSSMICEFGMPMPTRSALHHGSFFGLGAIFGTQIS